METQYVPLLIQPDDGQGPPTQVLVPVDLLQSEDGIVAVSQEVSPKEEAPSPPQEASPETPPPEVPETATGTHVLNVMCSPDSSAAESVRIELTVRHPDFKRYLSHIAFDFTLRCRYCDFSAKLFSAMAKHLDRGSCSPDNAWESPPAPRPARQLSPFACEHCPNTRLLSKPELDLHKRCHALAAGDRLSCCFCRVPSFCNTRNWSILKAHLSNRHGTDFQLPCPRCTDVRFKTHLELKHHTQAAHQLRCDLCDLVFESYPLLAAHKECHDMSEGLDYRCFVCGFRCSRRPASWPAMLAHLRSAHPKCLSGNVEEGPPIHCYVCEKEVSLGVFAAHMHDCIDRHQDRLLERMQEAGLTQQPGSTSEGVMTLRKKDTHRCSAHGLRFDSPLELARHFVYSHFLPSKRPRSSEETPHNSVSQAAEGGEPAIGSGVRGAGPAKAVNPAAGNGLKCQLCYKTLSSRERLESHVRRVHPPHKRVPVPCQLCGKFFKNACRVRNHVREVHEGKTRVRVLPRPRPSADHKTTFVCETCGYVTPSRVRLRHHQQSVHQGALPFACDCCEYKTSERSDLLRHRQRHAGIKRYACPHCAYRTNERWVLVNHCLRQHDVRMPRRSRDTLGLPGSLRRQQLQQQRARRSQPPLEDGQTPPPPGAESPEVVLGPVEITGLEEEEAEAAALMLITQ